MINDQLVHNENHSHPSQKVGTEYLRVVAGGWMHAVDYNVKCTSTLIDAFAAHLIDLDVEGVIPQVCLRYFVNILHARRNESCIEVQNASLF